MSFPSGYYSFTGLSNATAGTNALGLELLQGMATVVVTVSGTYVGTLQFEGSGDGDTTWQSCSGTLSSNPATAATSTTSTGQWRFPVAGLTSFRVRMSAYTSGTANATIQSSRGTTQ